MMNFVVCIIHLMSLGCLINEDEVGRALRGRGEVFTGFWSGGPKGRGHWEDLGVGEGITLRWTLGR
jgi:hypothetical protein